MSQRPRAYFDHPPHAQLFNARRFDVIGLGCGEDGIPRPEYVELQALCGMCQGNRGCSQTAKEPHMSSLEVFTQTKGEKDLRTIALRHRLGWTIRAQGDLAASERYSLRTMADTILACLTIALARPNPSRDSPFPPRISASFIPAQTPPRPHTSRRSPPPQTRDAASPPPTKAHTARTRCLPTRTTASSCPAPTADRRRSAHPRFR